MPMNLESLACRFGLNLAVLKFHVPHHHVALSKRITRRMWIQVAKVPVLRSVLSSAMKWLAVQSGIQWVIYTQADECID